MDGPRDDAPPREAAEATGADVEPPSTMRYGFDRVSLLLAAYFVGLILLVGALLLLPAILGPA